MHFYNQGALDGGGGGIMISHVDFKKIMPISHNFVV